MPRTTTRDATQFSAIYSQSSASYLCRKNSFPADVGNWRSTKTQNRLVKGTRSVASKNRQRIVEILFKLTTKRYMPSVEAIPVVRKVGSVGGEEAGKGGKSVLSPPASAQSGIVS